MPDFDEYVNARGTALVRFALMLCGDQHRAEDVVQSSLVRAFRSWHRIGSMTHPDSYVKRMILHEWLSWRRRLSSSEIPVSEIDDRMADTVPAPSEPTVLSRLWQAMASLPPRQRTVLVLRYYEDLSNHEIADLLGCAEATVRSSISRSFAQLRANPLIIDERTAHD